MIWNNEIHVQPREAIEDLQDAADAGYDTTDLQVLITNFASIAVLLAIEEAIVNGDDVTTAQSRFDEADVLAASSDYLAAVKKYKSAAQSL